MDEIDAIGGRRFSEGTSADREIQRTLMELLNQLDGFDNLGKVLLSMTEVQPRSFWCTCAYNLLYIDFLEIMLHIIVNELCFFLASILHNCLHTESHHRCC